MTDENKVNSLKMLKWKYLHHEYVHQVWKCWDMLLGSRFLIHFFCCDLIWDVNKGNNNAWGFPFSPIFSGYLSEDATSIMDLLFENLCFLVCLFSHVFDVRN
jgi:hypothetical protein